MFNTNISNKGVSPVVGVILMMAVTVVLVSLITVIVFDFSNSSVQEPAKINYISEGDNGEPPELRSLTE